MRYLFFGFLFLLVACQEQKVNLAEVDQTLIADVVDYSAIYFFYEESGDDGLHLSVNDHNRIGTTNWIFHVDKKLPVLSGAFHGGCQTLFLVQVFFMF